MAAEVSPSSWETFNRYLDGLDDSRQSQVRGSFPRFWARYRAARSMKITLDGYSTEDTPAGYVAIIQCGMAYSVLESLEKAIKTYTKSTSCPPDQLQRQRVRVESASLAEFYRADGSERLRSALQEHLDSEKLLGKIQSLGISGTDVTPLAEGIRHLAFHGVFTPGTIGYKLKGKNSSVSDLMNQLPEVVLDSTNDHFTQWCTWIKAQN